MKTKTAKVERMYSIPQVAELTGYSPNTVRGYFRNRAGVLKPKKNGKMFIRIPESVYLEWVRESSTPIISKSLTEALSRRA